LSEDWNTRHCDITITSSGLFSAAILEGNDCSGAELQQNIGSDGEYVKVRVKSGGKVTFSGSNWDKLTQLTVPTTVIVGASQLGLQIHESCGHAIELDRVLGSEAAYAGTSFLTTDKLNNFQYGSEQINITADSVRLPGLGSYGWDDEGVEAQSTPVVQNGRFVGYLMSRETASGLDLRSNGSMRAASWNRIPLIRMNNVSLEPGDWSLEDLIADTDDGILMEMNRSWSIDDRRYNFQFGTETGYEIKKGKLGKLLRNCT
jgi:TldD protein